MRTLFLFMLTPYGAIIHSMKPETKEYWKPILRYFIYLVLVLGLTVLAFVLTIGNNSQLILDTIKAANGVYILIVLAIVVMCFMLRSLAIFFLTRIYEKRYPFHRAIAIDQIGTLYRMITPAGLGGHFSELVFYRKQKISVSDALSVLAMYSIVYQIVLILFNIVTLCVKGSVIQEIGQISISFTSTGPISLPLWLLVIIGFIINISVIGFIFLMSYWNGFYHFIYAPFGNVLHALGILKDLDDYHTRLDRSVDNFRCNLKQLLTHIPTLLAVSLCFIVYIGLSYSVPYFCGLALGNNAITANIFDSILLSNFHQMITCIIPIPGSAITSEMFFLKLFYPENGPVFYETEAIARSALLLWRSLMFIFPLFISCLYALIYRPRKRNIYAND